MFADRATIIIKSEMCIRDRNMTEAVYPEKPVVPFIKATQDRVVLEIQRGCIRGCRFCQAGMVYRCLLYTSYWKTEEK